jgi:DNA-binding transcriptional regulator LsrR (DeoR family)
MPRKSRITEEDINLICRSYYLSDSSQADVARQFKLSPTTIKNIIEFYGGKFCNDNKEELFEWRRNRG